MPTGTVDHKTQDLLEKHADISTLSALSDRAEKPVYQRKELDAVQICNKQRQPGSTRQPIFGCFDSVNFQFLFAVTSAIFIHKVLHLLGLASWFAFLVAFKSYTNKLPLGEGLFYCMNRLT
jgi:hypothetical protein